MGDQRKSIPAFGTGTAGFGSHFFETTALDTRWNRFVYKLTHLYINVK